MKVDRTATAGAALYRKRLGVWESEGGYLHSPGEGAVPADDSLHSDDDATSWEFAALLSDLPEEEAIHLDLTGIPICLVRSQGAVHALLDECSHGHVALSDGEVEEGVIECWLHGSCFDLTSGVPTGPPAIVPVPVYAVRIAAGNIEIALPTRGSRGPAAILH